jgi:hypothetical protein
MAGKMMDTLNQKFGRYGIVFEQCSVTRVHANDAVLKSLETRT